jgi:hypothetical protein
MYNTEYVIRLTPYREMRGQVTNGQSYETINGRTTYNGKSPIRNIIVFIVHSILWELLSAPIRCCHFRQFFLEDVVLCYSHWNTCDVAVIKLYACFTNPVKNI